MAIIMINGPEIGSEIGATKRDVIKSAKLKSGFEILLRLQSIFGSCHSFCFSVVFNSARLLFMTLSNCFIFRKNKSKFVRLTMLQRIEIFMENIENFYCWRIV